MKPSFIPVALFLLFVLLAPVSSLHAEITPSKRLDSAKTALAEAEQKVGSAQAALKANKDTTKKSALEAALEVAKKGVETAKAELTIATRIESSHKAVKARLETLTSKQSRIPIARKIAKAFRTVSGSTEANSAAETAREFVKAGIDVVSDKSVPDESERQKLQEAVRGLVPAVLRMLDNPKEASGAQLFELIEKVASQPLSSTGFETPEDSTQSIRKSINAAMDAISAKKTDQTRRAVAAELRNKIMAVSSEDKDYATIDLAEVRMQSQIRQVAQLVPSGKRGAVIKHGDSAVEQLLAQANGKPKELVRLLKEEVLIHLAFHSKADDSIQTEFGLTQYIVDRAEVRESDLGLDVVRNETAQKLATAFRRFAADVTTDPRSTFQFMKEDVKPGIDAILEPVNKRVRGDRKPWDKLREEWVVKINILQSKGKLDLTNRDHLRIMWTELADAFDLIAKKINEDKGLTTANNSGSSVAGRGLFGSQGLSIGSAFELKYKLEARREMLALQREFIEDEYKLRRRIAKEENEGKRKVMLEKLRVTRKEFEQRLKLIEQSEN